MLLIKGKPKSSIARGEGLAVSTSGKSMILPGYNNLLATNFIVSGLGVISVYMLITGLPVLIIKKPFKTVKVVNPRHFQAVRLTNSRLSRFSFQIRTGSAVSPGCSNLAGILA